MNLQKEYALIGATLIDGNGGSPVKDTSIVVRNGVIEEVGDRKSVRLGDKIQKVDISGFYLMPGLVDSHAHFAGLKLRSANPSDWVAESESLQAIRTVAEARKMLDYGFTTVRSGGGALKFDIDLRKAVEEGTIIGPRIMACGLRLCRSGASEDPIGTVDGVEEIRKAIRKLIGENVDHIKFVSTGADMSETDRFEDVHFSMEEMRMIMDESHMVGLKVMCHATNIRAIRAVVELGVNTIEHCQYAEGDEFDEELCKKMAEKNIFITPTIAEHFTGPAAEKEIPKYLVNGWKRAMKNGVKILLGSDVWGEPITPYGKQNIAEIKFLVDILEMTPLEAITSATKFGAEACGIDSKVGTIEKGKLADLLVVSKDPTSNIDVLLNRENVKYIIKEGNLVVEH